MSIRVIARGDDGEEVDITENVIAVYDVAANSMDFGSGFLDTQEVSHLKTLGRVLGAQTLTYQHDKCDRCGHDRELHQTKAERREGGCYWGYYIRTSTPARMCDCPGFLDLDGEGK